MNKFPMLILAVLCTMPTACTTSGAQVQKGMNAYQTGDDRGAMAQFVRIEEEIPNMNPKGLMRYTVYRGLTAYNLGDLQQAEDYLRQGKTMYERGNSAWLPPNVVQRMHAILAELDAGRGPSPNHHE